MVWYLCCRNLETVLNYPAGLNFFLSNFVLEILHTIGSHFFPAGIYLLKVNNRNIRARCGICSKLTIKIIVNFEHISHVVLGFYY